MIAFWSWTDCNCMILSPHQRHLNIFASTCQSINGYVDWTSYREPVGVIFSLHKYSFVVYILIRHKTDASWGETLATSLFRFGCFLHGLPGPRLFGRLCPFHYLIMFRRCSILGRTRYQLWSVDVWFAICPAVSAWRGIASWAAFDVTCHLQSRTRRGGVYSLRRSGGSSTTTTTTHNR